jgi:large subunit ribosomal protein L25
MKSVSLNVAPRTLVQRSGVKKVRAASRIPAVVYGRHHPPQSLEITQLDFERVIHQSASENILVDLDVQGDARPKRLALVQEVQHHPLSGKVLHVDFHEVAENEKVTVMVPVETVGEAVGVKNGGLLEHLLFRLKVRALPKDLPEFITLDVSKLEIGHAIHIGEVPAPPGAEILGDKRISVVAIAAPITEEQEAAAEAAVTAEGISEPEVIKEKKEAGEAAEGAPAKAAEKGAEKKAAEKGAEKGAEKPAEKGAEKKAEKKK